MEVLATTDITFDCALGFLKSLERNIRYNYNKCERLRINISNNKDWILNMCDAVLTSNEAIHSRIMLEEKKRNESIKNLCKSVAKSVEEAKDVHDKMESMVNQIRNLEIGDAINLLLAHGFNIGKNGQLVGDGRGVAGSLAGDTGDTCDTTENETTSVSASIEDDLLSPGENGDIRVIG